MRNIRVYNNIIMKPNLKSIQSINLSKALEQREAASDTVLNFQSGSHESGNDSGSRQYREPTFPICGAAGTWTYQTGLTD